MRKILVGELKRERCNAPALGLYNQAVGAGAIEPGEKASVQELEEKTSDENSSKRLQILENSLKKKEAELDRRFDDHFGTWKQTNGQPMNDKRNGGAFFNKVERQNDAIRNMQASIQKTKDAIEREKNKIYSVNSAKSALPKSINTLINNKELNQWRKHPNTFFVPGVDKARIVWDPKKKQIAHKYANTLPTGEARTKFANLYNKLSKELNKK